MEIKFLGKYDGAKMKGGTTTISITTPSDGDIGQQLGEMDGAKIEEVYVTIKTTQGELFDAKDLQ